MEKNKNKIHMKKKKSIQKKKRERCYKNLIKYNCINKNKNITFPLQFMGHDTSEQISLKYPSSQIHFPVL